MKLTAALCLATALILPMALAGCNDEGVGGLMAQGPKETRPIPLETIKLMEEKGMRKEDPILIRAFKEDNTLEIWKRDKTNKYALLKSYNLCAWGGTIGPKIVEGDKMSPEGFYQITPGRMNPRSSFFLSMDLGYPNAFDRAHNRTGSYVMIHGNCTASAGCFVLTDNQVQEVYAIAREALAGGQSSIQVQAYPFRMTAMNLAKHRRNPNMAFWRMIKQGYDHFEVTHLEPKVDVCDKKYVFDAKATDAMSTTFNAQGACPAYQTQPEIAAAVADKEKADETAYKVQVAELDKQERAAAEAELAMKMEAAKPKQQPTSLFASFSPKPAVTPAAGPVATSVADAKPVNLPVPKPSPLAVASAQPAASASAYGAAEKPAGGDVFSGLMNMVKLPGSETPAPATAQLQPAVATAPVAADTRGVTEVKTGATPAAVTTTPARSTTPTTSQSTARPASVTATAAPVSQPVAPAAPAAETPWWKKLNPFGG